MIQERKVAPEGWYKDFSSLHMWQECQSQTELLSLTLASVCLCWWGSVQPVMRSVVLVPAHLALGAVMLCTVGRLSVTLVLRCWKHLLMCLHHNLLFMLLYSVLGRAGQPAAQLSENSLVADSTSITLESLQPDTEYVISLYPLFPRNSASPSILTARTCKFTPQDRFPVFGEAMRAQYYSDCLCVHVFACFSASWGGAAALSQDGVRGQRACAMERRPRCEGLQADLWSVERSAGRRRRRAFFEFAHRSIVCVFMIQKGDIVETVDLASDAEAYTLSGLQPNTDYIVTVLTLYEGNVEGPVATAAFDTGGWILSDLQFDTFFLVPFCLRHMSRTTLHTLCRLAICLWCVAHIWCQARWTNIAHLRVGSALREEERKPELWEIQAPESKDCNIYNIYKIFT